MNKNETEAILKLLRALDENPQMTQRQLSSHLGLSLGKINFLLRALIDRGLIKSENFKNSKNKLGYLYLLTPGGIEEKARITYRFLKRKTAEYEMLKDEIRRLKEEVALIEDARAGGHKPIKNGLA
ncbi:MAG: MarR family EPS-associated transcriptional regulator [Deltaproteobacteria bacterium]|nr:MarR family EPS-associated transcriptional regulator [Deltaproteobacteria bacterium]